MHPLYHSGFIATALHRARQRAPVAAMMAAVAGSLLVGCVRQDTREFRVADGQREVPMELDASYNTWTFYALRQPIQLQLQAPPGLRFVANQQERYALPLAAGQREHLRFDLESNGTPVEGALVKPRQAELTVEGYERPDSQQQPFERRIWTKAMNNKPHTSRLVSVEYRYALTPQQKTMVLQLGNFRHDPVSQFRIQGTVAQPTVMLQAPPGESFVFAPGQSMGANDPVPNGSTRATSYQVALKPGQSQSLVFWMANRNERLNRYNVELSYSMP